MPFCVFASMKGFSVYKDTQDNKFKTEMMQTANAVIGGSNMFGIITDSRPVFEIQYEESNRILRVGNGLEQ